MQQNFIQHLVSDKTVGNKTPILCNQENFILKSNFYKIKQTLPDFHIFFNPAVKNTLDRGRPKGGMFIAVPNTIRGQVTDISPGHWRVQAINISSSSSNTLLINTYFPCDSRQALEAQDEALEVLELVKRLIETSSCNSVVWCGDINTDFSRNTWQVAMLREAIAELNLLKVVDKFPIDFTCINNVNDENVVTSVIDHFFYSSEISKLILDAGVIHSPDNRSDHCPVYCVLSCLNTKLDSSDVSRKPPKPSWQSSTAAQKDHYRSELELRLSCITVPPSLLQCKDVSCKNSDHCDLVDQLTQDVLEAVQYTAEECLVCPGGGTGRKEGSKSIPGWNESVRHHKETAYFWHQLWLSCGKPINTEIHRIMKRTRNLYHSEIRKIKKSENLVRKNKLLNACLNGEGDIFKDIKSLRNTRQVVANTMDGVKEDLANHFRNIYSNLYNSVEDSENLARVSEQIELKIGDHSLQDIAKVTPSAIKEAASKLRPGKTDPVYSFSSDCFKVESDKLAELLSTIIQCYLIHGHVTRFLLLATLVPIIKDKLGSINSSKNYRSIAISSIILKLLDWIITLLFGSSLQLHDLQFAYQPGISGNMCTYAVLETIDYFLRHGSEVFMCTMDMTKAFDMTVHSILFSKMLKAGVSAIFLRLLVFTYSEQFANVR